MRLLLFCVCAAAVNAWPLYFEPNQGQVKGRTQWITRSGGANVYLAGNEVMLGGVRMRLVSARNARIEGLDPTGGTSSYFLGASEEDAHTGIPHYARVRAPDVYRGIDVVYYGAGDRLEYDFVVTPDGDPSEIELAFSRAVRIDERGDLMVGDLRQRRPRVVQDGREIPSTYRVVDGNRVRIDVGGYDRNRILTIDPVLEFSTYLGGPGYDSAFSVKLDASGNIVVGGGGQTPATPTLDPFQQTSTGLSSTWVIKLTPDARRVLYYAVLGVGGGGHLDLDPDGSPIVTGKADTNTLPLKNAFQSDCGSITCSFVAKLSPDGRSLMYASYLSGSNSTNDAGGVAADSEGNVYIVGTTNSHDFPTKNATQPSLRGQQNCFATKIAPSGELLFSTYLGSTGTDGCSGAAIGMDGAFLFSGFTLSGAFPTVDAPQSTGFPGPYGAPLLVKMAPDGHVLLATYLGGQNFSGTASGIAVGADGGIYIAGRAFNTQFTFKKAYQTSWGNDLTGWLMKLNASGTDLQFATFFGGAAAGGWFQDIAVGPGGDVYGIGLAAYDDFPVKDSLQSFRGGNAVVNSDAFLTVFAPSGQSLVYSTLLGGTNEDWPLGLAVGADGAAYVSGFTLSRDFPSANAYQRTYGGGQSDAFLLKVSDSSLGMPMPVLETAPGRLTFQYVQGGSAPPSQSVAVTGSDAYVVSTAPLWISASQDGSDPPNTLHVTVAPGDLAPGSYTGSITLRPESGAPSTSVDVALTIYAPAPVLTGTEPELVPAGSDDTLITLKGSGFVTETELFVDGVGWGLSPVMVVDANTIQFRMPKAYFAAVTSFAITVRNPQSLASNAVALAVGQPGPRIAAGGVVNAASYAPPPVAVGEIVVIFGERFGSAETVKVLFDSVPAAIVYATPGQIAATVPGSVGNRTTTSLVVQDEGVGSPPVVLPVAAAAPGLFTADASGQGQAAALNQDYSINSAENPAAPGSVLQLYGTGGGVLSLDDLPRVTLPVSVAVDGVAAEVLYAGAAPGLPEGALQVNVRIPPETHPGAASVELTIGSVLSNSVTVEVRE